MSHIAELRRRLTVTILVLGAMVIGLYFLTDQIYAFIMAPMRDVVGNAPAVTLDVLEGMSNRFRLSAWSALVLGSPLVIYQTLAFFLPALRPKERAWFMWTFAAGALLFLAGAAFCYLLVLQTATEWLAAQNGQIFEWVPRASSLMTFAMWLVLGFGMSFEVPVVVFYLVYFGVVPYDKLRKNWRVVWVVMTIIAAMVTPDWSPVTMGLLAGSMIVLYEASMLLVRVFLARKIRRQAAAEAEL